MSTLKKIIIGGAVGTAASLFTTFSANAGVSCNVPNGNFTSTSTKATVEHLKNNPEKYPPGTKCTMAYTDGGSRSISVLRSGRVSTGRYRANTHSGSVSKPKIQKRKERQESNLRKKSNSIFRGNKNVTTNYNNGGQDYFTGNRPSASSAIKYCNC